MLDPLKNCVLVASILALFLLVVPGVHASTGTINATDKYAWSENGGWINFNATSSNVIVSDTNITGYAWSQKFGWIHLNPTSAGVTNTIGGDLGGYAWGEQTGYIDFSAVSINASGEFSGYATNPITGQISFNCSNTASCGSSNFKVKTDWTQGGTPSSTQRLAVQSLSIPQIGPVIVQGPNSILFNWTYQGSSQSGFRLLDSLDEILVEITDPGALSVLEEGLPENSLVSGREVLAFNSGGSGTPSEVYPDVYTHIAPVTPTLVSRVNAFINVGIAETPVNIDSGQSGIQFQLMGADGQGVTDSPWSQSTTYLFDATNAEQSYYVRARARNYEAVESAWSNNLIIEAKEQVAPGVQFSLGFTLTTSDGRSAVGRSIDPDERLSVQLFLVNNGDDAAQNTFLNFPLPQYIDYVPATLNVDGIQQTDSADEDAGQADGATVAAIWQELGSGQSRVVRFVLGFDSDSLMRDFSTPEQAAAALKLALQAFVSHDANPEPVFSNLIEVEPDLSVFTTPPIPAPEPIPLPEPTVEPVPTPTREEVRIIDDLIESVFSIDEITEAPPATEPDRTVSSFDERSFNVNTTSGLGLIGSASVGEDQIEFVGTTTEPYTVITLIFNDLITSIVTSDALGNWSTFVSAERLGLQPGQEVRMKIEAVAAKDDRRSERVQVGDVTITRGQEGSVVTDFQTTVSANATIAVLKEIRKQTVEIIEKQEPVIQATLSVAAPVVVVSSVPLWGYLPYVPTMIYHLITYLIGLIGRKKKGQQRFYGVVYDSITKLPLPLAIVRIYSLGSPVVVPNGSEGSLSASRKLVSTVVTDKLGRYEALLAPGKYTLEVAKPAYQFPSQIVTTSVDAHYHAYKEQDGLKIGETGTEITVPDVPLDPVNVQRQWQVTSGIKKVWLAIQKVGNKLAVPVLLVGSFASIATVIVVPDNGINWLLAVMYVLLLAAQLRLRPKLLKAWGVVYDIATNAVLPLTTIQLIDPSYGKVVTSRLSDYEGRFSFLPEPGKYVIKASKPGFEQVTEVVETPQTNRQPMKGEVQIDKPDQRISGDVAMKISN